MKQKILLNNVTLVGLDCVNIDRLIFAADICQKHIEFGAVKLLSSIAHDDKNVVAVHAISSIEDYSYFMLKKLHHYIDTEFAMVIQWDGFVLNPWAWNAGFLDYDYIGAAWWYDDAYNVGNGGFSIRSKKLLEMTAMDDNLEIFHPEDDVICRTYGQYFKDKGIKFADVKLAQKFSVERNWDGEFGFHNCNISRWDIHQFADPEKHQPFIDEFYRYFRQ